MKIAIIAYASTDIEVILAEYADVERIHPEAKVSLCDFDACAVLGGSEDEPVILPIDMRLEFEAFRHSGKPVFAEWTNSIGNTFMDDGTRVNTVSHRMIFAGEDESFIRRGDLLDDHANTFYSFFGLTATAKPILCLAGHVIGHDRIDAPEYKAENYTLFTFEENTIICAFRMCNYVKARFAPQKRWDGVVSLIVSHLVGKRVHVATTPAVCTDHAPTSPEECFGRGLAWIEGAQILIDNGESGVLEGLSHHVLPNGRQLYSRTVRNDCSGEIGGAYFFDAYNKKNENSHIRFKNLQKFCFEKLYETEGVHKGMMRWSSTAWECCYQDDVARTVLASLISMQLTDDRQYLDRICGAMDYLLCTTGTDGLRVSRTDTQYLPPHRMEMLKSSPSRFTCAHHNGYYMAVLLLTYSLTGDGRYLDVARRGIDSLMAVFPDTIREHSETQELCRLILPLACLYEITGEEQHREYLYRVVDRLEQYRDARGGYREYDTGYKAKRSRTSGTESSLLADNGDPVEDLLYSVNWLPLSFAYAYKATGDGRFVGLWRDIVTFLSEIQAVCDDKTLHGSWSRAIDCERREAYGMPHDMGWGPCAVESGWTVGEILMGIGYGIALGLDKK